MSFKSVMWSGEVFGPKVELGFNDEWRCEMDGEGRGAGCQHVMFARRRSLAIADGDLDEFACRRNVTIMSALHAPRPKKPLKVAV